MPDIFYTKDHEWIKVNGSEGLVGITPYASEQLGDIVFVELPQKGISFGPVSYTHLTLPTTD